MTLILSNGKSYRELFINGAPSNNIVFNLPEQNFFSPNKGVVDWKDVDRFIYKKDNTPSIEGELKIKLMNRKIIPIGTISDNCWKKFQVNFGKYLEFEKIA